MWLHLFYFYYLYSIILILHFYIIHNICVFVYLRPIIWYTVHTKKWCIPNMNYGHPTLMCIPTVVLMAICKRFKHFLSALLPKVFVCTKCTISLVHPVVSGKRVSFNLVTFWPYWRSDVQDILTLWCSGHTNVLMFWTYWRSDVLDTSAHV